MPENNIFRHNKYADYQLLFVVIFISIISFLTQINLKLNADVASLFYDTEIFLSGGTYVKDFFETNPPMIFILYTPIIYLYQLTSYNIIYINNLYIISLVFLSLSLANILLKKILTLNYAYLRYFLMIMLSILFLILPINDFGQREHYLIILSTPYILAIIIRADKKSITPIISIIIGCMAGIAFSLKPFFLFTLIFLEFYLMLVTKNIWSILRLDTLIIISIILSYLLFINIFHPLYYTVMLNLVNHWYFLSTEESWTIIFTRPIVVFCIITLMLYIFFYKKLLLNIKLTHILFLSLIGFMLAFIVPRSAWVYHVLPAYFFALLLYAVIIYQIWHNYLLTNTINYVEMIVITLVSFALPIAIYCTEVKTALEILNLPTKQKLFDKVSIIKPNSIYCFSAITTGVCFPFVKINSIKFAGRFPFFWWLRGMIKMETQNSLLNLPKYYTNEKKYFLNIIATDLKKYKPQLIVIPSYEENIIFSNNYTYPKYFSTNKNFVSEWQHYKLLANMSNYKLYQRKTD